RRRLCHAHARRHREERGPVAVHPVNGPGPRSTRSTQSSQNSQSIFFGFFSGLRRVSRTSLSTQRKVFSALSASSAVFAFAFVISCGKKGPPLPPLVKVPVAPPGLAASPRGDIVDLQF